MKKNLYTTPLIEVLEIEIEDVLCQSINTSSDNALTIFEDNGLAW